MAAATIQTLREIMAKLRDPLGGCPWDLQQDFDSIAPYTIEEAYEVAEAIARRDHAALCDELGDLLLQVVFHAQMAQEAGQFAFDDVVTAICDKMVRRHPHVFANASVANADEQTLRWDEIKAAERAKSGRNGLLAQVKQGQPELVRAVALQKAAAKIGFDWPSIEPVFDKLQEEIAELREAIAAGADADKLSDELGDVLFVASNIARHLQVDPGASLRLTNAKFERRFARMEALAAAEQINLDQLGLAELDAYWNRARQEDHDGLLG